MIALLHVFILLEEICSRVSCRGSSDLLASLLLTIFEVKQKDFLKILSHKSGSNNLNFAMDLIFPEVCAMELQM